MSFQDVPSGGRGRPSSSSSSMASKNPSQPVAAGIFQINTAVAAFRRLVDAIGTAKDTPDHRQKLYLFVPHLVLYTDGNFSKMNFHKVANEMIDRHNTRQRILQLVKETSAKLKALSESDHDPTINVFVSFPKYPSRFFNSFHILVRVKSKDSSNFTFSLVRR